MADKIPPDKLRRRPLAPKRDAAEQLSDAQAEARSRADFDRRQMPLPGVDGKPLCWWRDANWGTKAR